MTVNKEELIQFEEEIAELFNNGMIKAPVHLYNGNEENIIGVFQNIDIEKDWVCCTWRNHYQALLKGIPVAELKQLILEGKSMSINLPEYKFVTSAIVGGIPSIATGIALANKLQNIDSRVWCWLGDMSAETGHFHEAWKYSVVNDLKITFVIEDNEKSVCTPTHHVWGSEKHYLNPDGTEKSKIIYYKYNNKKYPHAGAGKRVQF